MWSKRLATGTEITALGHEHVSPTDIRVVAGTYSGHIHIFQYDGRTELHSLLTMKLDSDFPVAASFIGSKGQELRTFGLRVGAMLEASQLCERSH